MVKDLPKFFVPAGSIADGKVTVTGEDARHISKVLRLRAGDKLTVCDGTGCDFDCEITSTGDTVTAKVLSKSENVAEPTVAAALFMAMPKGDKFEQIIQKTVELGINEIYPVITERCVARPDKKSFEKKLPRYQAISQAAAKQSGRGIVPKVGMMLELSEAIEKMRCFDSAAVLYETAEKGGIEQFLQGQPASVAFLIGSEGGFAASEIDRCRAAGLTVVGLGSRILRCETAPVSFLSLIMYITGNLG